MPLSRAERDAIIAAAFEKTRQEFAAEIARRTGLTELQVQSLAKTAEERQALAQVLAEVAKTTQSNNAKAAAIRGITGGVEALVRLAGALL